MSEGGGCPMRENQRLGPRTGAKLGSKMAEKVKICLKPFVEGLYMLVGPWSNKEGK